MRAPSATRGRAIRRGGAGSRGVARADLTPMIDVVFLLIIFFLVSSHLARRETRLRLDLPTATTGEPDRDPSPRLTINVEADGRLRLGAETVTPAELVARLSRQREASAGPLRVRLRGDRMASYASVEPALAACAEAGLEDIALAVFATGGR